jgi:Prenyltransferase and squalene oxidase repeat
MFATPAFWLAATLLLEPPSPGMVRSAVQKALPLLIKGAQGHVEKKTCFACHNQAVPMLAFQIARQHGFAIPDEVVEKQLAHIVAFLDANRAGFLQGQGTGGQVDTAGYALFALGRGGRQSDATTSAVIEYLLQRNKDLDHWRPSGSRPPSEASPFSTNYFGLRALQTGGAPTQKDRIAKRVETIRGWLLKTKAADTEDRVFRLSSLSLLQVDGKKIKSAVKELLDNQRPDGGWGQLPNLKSDAYATGSVLVALHQAGGLAVSERAYRRGLGFLVRSQRDDGSWFVHSRSDPFQPYYESGFPHGKDQFISMAASAWATSALALACPPSN